MQSLLAEISLTSPRCLVADEEKKSEIPEPLANLRCRYISEVHCCEKRTFANHPNINKDQRCFSDASKCSIGTGLPNKCPWN